MVFPQGKFSNQAMDSMKENSYIAAINTNPISANLEGCFDLKDYFGTYIVKYGGFPLFTRNTPEDAMGISNNLFFGKPAFIVIHHDYLKDDYQGLIAAINGINSRSADIKWAGAGEIIFEILDGHKDAGDKIQENIGISDLRTDGLYGVKKKIFIYIRREFCNFRDNYLSKNNTMMFAYNYFQKIVKR
jgi:hypothetical protein